nr:peptidoglycan DD-metalloendopeptidase family protein [Pseudomonas typographi]
MAAAVVLSTFLAGCSSSPGNGVRVVDRSASRSNPNPQVTTGQYRVKPGDTLYSIAFRYGWDYKALAARNNIDASYTIHPGQVLRFDSASSARAPVVAATAPATVVNQTSATPSSSFKTTVIRKPLTGAPTNGTQPAPPAAANPSVASVPAPVPVPAGERNAAGWTWPANGTLIGKFASNGSLNKGIDIAGNLGQPVFAASDGSVVYAGSGLRGYGELVIIKHSDTYVSAYGHNRRLLVQEGQQVKAGQTIAEMGSTGTDRVKLHFEIRRQGKPVDPLQFLPQR